MDLNNQTNLGGPFGTTTNDTIGGVLTAVAVIILIFVVIIGLLTCSIIYTLKDRRKQRRQSEAPIVRNEWQAHRGLSILRGESFKHSARTLPSSIPNSDYDTIDEAPQGPTRLLARLDTIRSPSLTSSESSERTCNLADIADHVPNRPVTGDSVISDDHGNALLEVVPQFPRLSSVEEDIVPISRSGPMPYIEPISVSISSDEGLDIISVEPNEESVKEWIDSGDYAQLYSSLERHYYHPVLHDTSSESDESPPSSSYDVNPAYESATLLTLQATDVPRIHPQNITFLREFGAGHFGKVYLAETNSLSLKELRIDPNDADTNVSVLVAVKVLKENSPSDTQAAFVKEVKLLSRLSHNHIVNLLGVCSEGVPFIVMEFMINGDLKNYLRKFTVAHENDAEKNTISVSSLLCIVAQIVDGMNYLASLNLVHRDLAARNCLVGANRTIKIADFGLTKNLHYAVNRSNTALPLRHIPYESFFGKFSEKSDVWSFGITVWEIFTLGRPNPFSHLRNEDLVKDAMKGPRRKLLQKPANCPNDVYAMMLMCWKHTPNDRPDFKRLHEIVCSIQKA